MEGMSPIFRDVRDLAISATTETASHICVRVMLVTLNNSLNNSLISGQWIIHWIIHWLGSHRRDSTHLPLPHPLQSTSHRFYPHPCQRCKVKWGIIIKHIKTYNVKQENTEDKKKRSNIWNNGKREFFLSFCGTKSQVKLPKFSVQFGTCFIYLFQKFI